MILDLLLMRRSFKRTQTILLLSDVVFNKELENILNFLQQETVLRSKIEQPASNVLLNFIKNLISNIGI